MLDLDVIRSHWREPLNDDIAALLSAVERLRILCGYALYVMDADPDFSPGGWVAYDDIVDELRKEAGLKPYFPETSAEEVGRLNEENARLRETARVLYEALKEVEWIRIPAPDGMGYEACEWCHAEKHEGHLDNCSVGNAIARYEEESDESS